MPIDDIDDQILKTFEIHRKLGKGSYGIVWKAREKHLNKDVAVKKCFESFRSTADAQRTYREVMYLKALSGHENIIQLLDVYLGENGMDVYLIFETMETDLHTVIRSHGISLSLMHKKFIIYQTLKGLKYIHSAGLIHRDVKPSNILINADCRIKLCDFGLCRSRHASDGRQLTDYVATRWYRSPEILLGSTKYSTAIDIWAVGCLLAEMVYGKPILPGSSTMNQIEKIIQLFGPLSEEEVSSMKSQYAPIMLHKIPPVAHTNLSELLSDKEKETNEFISKCMKLNPSKRLTAKQALKHRYLAIFHDPQREYEYSYGPIKVSHGLQLAYYLHYECAYDDITYISSSSM